MKILIKMLGLIFMLPLCSFGSTSVNSIQNVIKAPSMPNILKIHVDHPLSISIAKTIYKIQYSPQVNQLINQINPQFLWSSLAKLTSFPDRSSETVNGIDAAYWIKSQIELIAEESGRKDITIFSIATKRINEKGRPIEFKQPSIVVKIGNSSIPGVLLGAHFDTYPKYDMETSKKICSEFDDPKIRKSCEDEMMSDKPGADDDGSGAVTLLETARILMNSGMKFAKPIYLVWYAAEEDGMIGSQAVVEDFQKRNIQISAVMQLDQVGFSYQSDPTMWLVTNYVDKDLTTYIATLIHEYVKQPVNYTESKGPASDNFSWFKRGIPVVFPFETEMKLGNGNLNVHTRHDTMDKLSLTHMLDYAKLAISFSVELAEPA